MDEIKTNRVNGYLNLDTYFYKRLKRRYIDLEDLYINGLIEYEPTGLSDKFWILSKTGERIALYKTDIPDNDESYIELLVEEIAKVMEIPTAHYDLAMFDNKRGVISYNFVKGENTHLSGFDIISDFYSKKLEFDEEISSLYNIDYINDSIEEVSYKLNNLQDVWTILEDRFKDDPNKSKIVKSIMDGLVNKLLLDVVVVGVDSHCDNWEIIDDEYPAPVFDNSRAIGMFRKLNNRNIDENKKIEDNKLLFTVDNGNIRKPLEVLSYFLKISSSNYKTDIQDKVNRLQDNINIIPLIIEKRTSAPMPEYLKNYFITNMSNHLENINRVINNKETKK